MATKLPSKIQTASTTSTPNSPNTFWTSSKEFGDFELSYEAKVDSRLNSGVHVRSAVIGWLQARSAARRARFAF